MPRTSDPDKPRKTTESRSKKRPTPDQYELKIRWDRARRVTEVTPTGVQFDFDSPLKVGTRYPVTLTAPGVALNSTIEVTRCQLTVQETTGRFFRVSARFFPYVE